MNARVFFPLTTALCILVSFGTSTGATIITNTPSDDGSLYICDGCNPISDGAYVTVAGYIQGDIKFSLTNIPGSVVQATLTVNPYGLPLWSPNLSVYAYTDTNGQLSVSDATAGTYIGNWVLPPGLGYGQDAYFDVTPFIMNSIGSPYVGFDLQDSSGADVFSSRSYNYGHPSELILTMIPEPTPSSLLVATVGALILVRIQQVKRRRVPRGAR